MDVWFFGGRQVMKFDLFKVFTLKNDFIVINNCLRDCRHGARSKKVANGFAMVYLSRRPSEPFCLYNGFIQKLKLY